MAINQYGKQTVLETVSGSYDSGDLTSADANNGLIVKVKGPNADYQDGIGKYEKPTADTDQFGGVILNVGGGDLSSTSVPRLDARGTAPDDRSVRLGTRGSFLLVKDAAVTPADTGMRVHPSATAAGQVTVSAATGKAYFGTVLASAVNSRNLILVKID